MGYDAMAKDTSSAPATAAAKETGKKKRVNRSAKLKQCKLDARREQWLSQGKNKGIGTATSSTSPPQRTSESGSSNRERRRSERDGLGLQEGNDVESPRHHFGRSPPRKECHRNNSTSSSRSSMGSFSGSVSDAEEETGENGGGGFDDWEAVADALSVTAEGVQDHRPKSAVTDSKTHGMRTSEPTKREPDRTISRAWRPDDVFRPQSLPNLSKQQSFSASIERHYAARHHDHRGILPTPPSSCPICYEDLDLTDTSFLPCSCGFHLCLFCHKRILEADGRCPGCRKQYSTMTSSEEMRVGVGMPVPSLPYRLSRSCSMSSRS
ncbi:uncharacterized protein M6B38_114600 [Iris pallida]|uniref:RING-type domain-containing protein n=1 Tax=Iris pallida TaxID=29817 RepID=A0AAX6GNW3_IRIPA|nr:uncharacterized protein M6B38_126295 [Iris pallida]KAJ6850738.1 uncharacterized protein M6B38_114600 [Iris pallida]